MEKPIVIFFSRSGITKQVGELIADKLNCKTAEIIDNKDRKGVIGMAKAVINPKSPTTIKDMEDPKDKLVIIGTPIWWYTYAPAVKTYLEKYKPKKVAFFYTCGADKKITAFEDMETASSKPLAKLRIDKNDIKDLENCEKIDEFVEIIKKSK